MARAELTVDTPAFSAAALTSTGVDAADTGDGDAFDNDGGTYFMTVNVDAADELGATIISGYSRDGLALGDQTIAQPLGVAAGLTTAKIFGPFPKTTWDQPTGDNAGQVQIDYTGTAAAITDSTISVFH